jgi:signal transduction histidine kinase/ActR/RegA family two-component response regulator/HPt (histidine-containing phosphotransfer) domain-containing protein
MTSEINKLSMRLKREKQARNEAEDLLEEKAAALFEKNVELKSLSESLEKLVAQRTSQMQRARDEALTALKVKSDFIANMSHELRTPMNGVLGILSLLDEEDLNEGQKELVSIAQSSGKHLLMVINDVLDFSKIEAEKIELVKAPLAIRQYIKGLCKSFELQAQHKNIEFTYKIGDCVPNTVITDELRLTQIITNLLSNAIKFTQQGSVFLSFELHQSSGNQEQIYRIAVSDTGIGISKENIKTVFAAFEQADTSITREFGGTGLGMNITKRLVDMFNATISIESQLGEGTCFYVDIPMALTGDCKLVEDTSDKLKDNDDLSSVLLVEDNKINQLVAQRMLENWGLKVTLAEDGQNAIDVLSEHTFDAVLMDLQMPVMGGIQATKEIRAKGIIDINTPIIAMTAHSSKDHIQECFDAGMQGHISKPIDKTALKKMLETFVEPIENVKPENKVTLDYEVEGIDFEDALNRLNGDWPLLHSLLNSFFEEYSELKEILLSYMITEDFEHSIALMHRVKGSSSNLGLTSIASLAGEGEKKLKAQQKMSASEIKRIGSAVESLSQHFAKITPPNQSVDTVDNRLESTEYLLQKMDEILLYLSKDVLASEDNLKDLLSCTLPSKTLNIVQDANEAMQKFDIESVKRSITLARQTLV